MDQNGNSASPRQKIVDSHERVVDRKRAWLAEDRELKAAAKRKLFELREEKYELMHQAGRHAGLIGLVYEPDTNFFSRVIPVDQLPVYGDRPALKQLELPSPDGVLPHVEVESNEVDESDQPTTVTDEVRSPETPPVEIQPVAQTTQPVARKRPEPPTIGDDEPSTSEPILKIVFSWVFSVLIGAFVGYGLLTISGLPFQRPGGEVYLYLFLGLGVAAIGSMKFLFESLWKLAGRRSAMLQSNSGFYALAIGTTAVLLAAEVYLGGFALVKYLEKTSFQGQGGLPQWQAMLLAASISSANLLLSAVMGYQKGQRSLSKSDRAHSEHMLALKEYELERERENRLADEERALELRVRERSDEIAAKAHGHNLALIDDQRLLHDEELANYRARKEIAEQHFQEGLQNRDQRAGDLEGFVKNSDYAALLQCIGSIKTITIQIEELERASTNESISRGHERRSQLH